jgi:hypothetical protein
MRVITRIATRVIALTVVAAVLVLSGGSANSIGTHTQLVTNPPSCC